MAAIRNTGVLGKVLLLPGDGIGPEVMREVRRVIDWMDRRRMVSFDLSDDLVGGVLSAGPDRLEAVGAAGVPQVVVLGGLDAVEIAVDVPHRSTVELAGWWFRSIDTRGSRVTSKIPFKGPAAARSSRALTSSMLVSRAGTKVRSTRLTFWVGTRMATPSSLPLSSGSTRPTALAAPVDVGIIETEAARARRRSLCSVSTVF